MGHAWCASSATSPARRSFTDQSAVVDGASELLRDLFGEEAGVGARLALGVTSLPANSPVEVELILESP